MVRFIKSKLTKNLLFSAAIGFLVFTSGAFLGNARAAAGDLWDDPDYFPGWISPEGHKYYNRIQILIQSNSGYLNNEPIMIKPSFPQGNCSVNSIRILYQESDFEYVEIPYILKNLATHGDGSVNSVEIIFVAPQIGGASFYYLIYSDNITIPAPNYTGKFSTVQNNQLNQFFVPGNNTWVNGLDFTYSGLENKSAYIYVPQPGAGRDVNVTHAEFDYTVAPTFYEQSSFQVPGYFTNMGPTSIKLYPGSVYGNPSITYMVVGTPSKLLTYSITSTGTVTKLVELDVPTDGGIAPLVSGMRLGKIENTANNDLVFGTKNGTIYAHRYNGDNSLDGLFYEYNVNDTITNQILQKPFGITTLNIYNYSWFDTKTDLILAGNSILGGKLKAFWHNASIPTLYPLDTRLNTGSIGTYADTNNWSIIADSGNFFPSKYAIDEGTLNEDVDEVMLAFPGSGFLNVGIYHPRQDLLFNQTWVAPRLKQGSTQYAQLVEGQGGGVAYSKKLTGTNDYMYTFAGMGTSGGVLYFRWKELSVVENSSTGYPLGQWGNGSMQFSSNANDRDIFYDYGDAILTPTWGNLDGYESQYDDMLFVDNTGRYHFYTFDTGLDRPVRRIAGTLLTEGLDLYGTGQSIDSIDINGDGIKEIFVADNNGVIHMLNFSFGKDIKTYARYGPNINDFNSYFGTTGTIYYTNTKNTTVNMKLDLNQYLGNDTTTVSSKQYTPCQVNIQAGSRSSLFIRNLNVSFETNDYNLVDPNRNVYPPQIANLEGGLAEDPYIKLQYADYDNDGLYDIFEKNGLLAWNLTYPGFPTSKSATVRIWIDASTPVVITNAWGKPLPAALRTNWQNNDTDGDGLTDGEELLIYRSNPNVIDTDDDYLDDYDEVQWYWAWHSQNPSVNNWDHPQINTFGTIPWNPDTDGDLLLDGQEINEFGSDPTNPNTDGDSVTFVRENGQVVTRGLSDYEEAILFNTDPTKLDTDGDGLTDAQELGLYDMNDPEKRLMHYLYSEGASIVYANTSVFIALYFPSWLPYLRLGLNPRSNDSDGDGLSDYDEIKLGFLFEVDGEMKRFYSSPVKNDTDGDGLLDGEELVNTFECWVLQSNGKMVLQNITVSTNPDNIDTDGDRIPDGLEIQLKINPTLKDTDFDFISDGDEYYGFSIPGLGNNIKTDPANPDTDGDGLLDGEEKDGILYTQGEVPFNFFGKDPDIKIYSHPLKVDTDGDGWTDYEEVVIHRTNPMDPDTDGDGLIDSVDPHPVLHESLVMLYYMLAYIAVIGAVAAAPLNWYSANKALARKYLYAEKISKATKRMARERREEGAFEIKANMIPTSRPEYFTVKLTMQIKDQSFFGRACRVSFSAGAKDYQTVNARKVSDEQYSFMLEEIPVDTRVLYFVEFLDRGGVWVRDDNSGKLYTFATNKEGTIDTRSDDEWAVERGVKCNVCGYLCLPEWDECPECNTPLHEDLSQELLLDEQKKKQAIQEKQKDVEAIAWEEAQKTDEVWRGLPPCPNCGVSVQPEWASCPVCGQSLKDVKLEKHAIYEWEEADADFIEGKDEEEIKLEYKDDTEATKSEKQLLDEEDAKKKKKKDDAWRTSSDEDIDIL